MVLDEIISLFSGEYARLINSRDWLLRKQYHHSSEMTWGNWGELQEIQHQITNYRRTTVGVAGSVAAVGALVLYSAFSQPAVNRGSVGRTTPQQYAVGTPTPRTY